MAAALYTCNMTFKDETEYEFILCTVRFHEAPLIHDESRDQVVHVGDDVTITCPYSSDSEASVQWVKTINAEDGEQQFALIQVNTLIYVYVTLVSSY